MTAEHGHLEKAGQLQGTLPECPKEAVLSPLGWSIVGRLICAAAASALLWLAVAWAIGGLG